MALLSMLGANLATDMADVHDCITIVAQQYRCRSDILAVRFASDREDDAGHSRFRGERVVRGELQSVLLQAFQRAESQTSKVGGSGVRQFGSMHIVASLGEGVGMSAHWLRRGKLGLLATAMIGTGLDSGHPPVEVDRDAVIRPQQDGSPVHEVLLPRDQARRVPQHRLHPLSSVWPIIMILSPERHRSCDSSPAVLRSARARERNRGAGVDGAGS